MKRFTRKNPNTGTYRAPFETIGELRVLQSGASMALFGDLINKLGKIEDEEEKKKWQ